MTSRRTRVVDLYLRGGDFAGTGSSGVVDSVVTVNTGGDQPTWNSSTTCIETIHRRMSTQDWNHWHLEIPLFDGEVGELPRRPLDLGVGRWR